MRVKLKDIEVADLNNVCIMIISKFARVLREYNGSVIHFRDKYIVQQVARHAAMSENPQLDALYLRLKVEIKNHLNKPAVRDDAFDHVIGETRVKKEIDARRLAKLQEKEK